MTFRRAKLDDVDQLVKLDKRYQKFFSKHDKPEFKVIGFNEDLMRKSFEDKINSENYFVYVVDIKNSLKAFFIAKIIFSDPKKSKHITKKSTYGVLEQGFVLKKYREQGYYNMFVEDFFKILKSRKISGCYAFVSDESLSKGICLDDGFEIVNYRVYKQV